MTDTQWIILMKWISLIAKGVGYIIAEKCSDATYRVYMQQIDKLSEDK